MNNYKKNISKFIKSKEISLEIQYKGKRLNSMWAWTKLKNPLKIYINAIVSEIGKKIPSLHLKNIVYKTIGMKIGKDVAIGPNVFIEQIFPELITIEDGALIGGHTMFMCHEFLIDKIIVAKTLIKKNAMIGTYVVIRGGVTIGKNSIVGTKSFVNKNIPDNELWGGVPARFIKKLK